MKKYSQSTPRIKWVFNSGGRIDYIPSLSQVSLHGCSLLMVDPVLKPVELIPVYRNSFPHRFCRGSINRKADLVMNNRISLFYALKTASVYKN